MAEQRGLSRRHLIAGAGVLGAAGVAGALAVDAAATDGGPDRRQVDFHGAHQAGIATPVQGHLHFASYDVTTTDRAALVALLQDWTAAAREMTADRRVGGSGSQSRLAPPSDTGEAVGLDAANLTLTVGFGPGLFDDRFGLAASRPAALADLPAFPGDTLDPALCGGDLAVQACSDDPQVAVHAVRNLTRIAAGRAAVRWAQLGFGKASATETAGPTPRNLFGFKDGTANILGDDTDALREHVWADRSDGSAWMAGGSYLVARRIRMTIETWDRTSLAEQETVIGRTKDVGAPLGRARERATVRPAELPADLARAAGAPVAARRCPAAASRLQLRRRLGRPGPPGRRAVLPGLPAGPAPGLRADPDRAGPARRDERVRAAHRLVAVGGPARRRARRLVGRDPARLAACWAEGLAL